MPTVACITMEAEVGDTSSDVEALVTPCQPMQPSEPLGSGPADTEDPDAEPPGGQDTPAASDPVEPLSAGNAAGKQKKTRRQEGSWNYTVAECVATVWAALTASEKGETDQQRLNSRVGEYYGEKVKELARAGFWKAPWTLASRGRVISTEKSISCRRQNPQGLWNKATDLRKDVQMHIAPKYAAVVEEGHSGWGLPEFLSATKRRYVFPSFSLQTASWSVCLFSPVHLAAAICLAVCLSDCLAFCLSINPSLSVCRHLCLSQFVCSLADCLPFPVFV